MSSKILYDENKKKHYVIIGGEKYYLDFYHDKERDIVGFTGGALGTE